VLTEPPNVDAGELSGKGSINALRRRHAPEYFTRICRGGFPEPALIMERGDGHVVGLEAKAKDTVTAEDFRGLAR
jgi:hypothetical protein